jgi:hypothetical protein
MGSIFQVGQTKFLVVFDLMLQNPTTAKRQKRVILILVNYSFLVDFSAVLCNYNSADVIVKGARACFHTEGKDWSS